MLVCDKQHWLAVMDGAAVCCCGHLLTSFCCVLVERSIVVGVIFDLCDSLLHRGVMTWCVG